MNLLIVDDQHVIRLLLHEIFQKEGYTTTLAPNGKEAIKAAKNTIFHCVLLDVQLPDMSGMEVVNQLNKIIPDVPVIMISAFEQAEMQAEKESNIVHYFTKPFDIYEVRNAVNKITMGE